MNRTINRRSGLPWLQFRPGRTTPAWTWAVVLAVVAALAANGCGGGGDEAASAPEEPSPEMGPPSEPAPKQPQPKQKKKEEAKPEEGPLPEDITAWVKPETFYQAKRASDARLPEAVAHLGEKFKGTPQADSAAVLLTNLLKKSEEPEPKKAARRPSGGPPAGYPEMDMGSSGMMPSGYPGDAGASMDEGGQSAEEDMAGDMGMQAEPGGMPGTYVPSEYGPSSAMGLGAGRVSGQRQGFLTELIRAIVSALGVNDSNTAHTTLKEVVEGTFETDDNRVATLATLETFVGHLCPEYEEVLYRCLTEPDKLRELGRRGQMGGPSGTPMAYPDGGMYGSGSASTGVGPGRGPLTAEELQRQAFVLIRPNASEQFRVRLAEHFAKPDTPQEDVDLFGPYLREATAENVAAQMVLYLAPAVDFETKETIEDNFLAFSSDALAGILGIPADQRTRLPSRRRQERGPGMYSGTEEYPGMSAMPGMEASVPAAVDEEAIYEAGRMGGPQTYPGQGPQPGMAPGGARGSGRPSRYDSQAAGARPSRYDSAQPGDRGPMVGGFQPPDPDLPYRLARHMWAGQMSKLVEGRLNEVDSLDSSARLLLLASTMPLDSTRSTLHQVLQRRWADGPGGLESEGLFDAVISDPGFLVLVKMLDRKAPPQAAGPTRPGVGRMRGGRMSEQRGAPGVSDEGGPGAMMPGSMEAGAESYMGPGGAERGRGQTPKEPEFAWMATSEELVRVVCERLLAAARASGGGGQTAGELPFEVRADASVVAEYHLDWPGSEQQKLTEVPLGQLKLHYLRAELDTRLNTLESYYKRQLGSADVRDIPNGTWMESVSTVPDADLRRSIDLMFTATVPAGEVLDKKQELPVTLDILCIDIKNPQPAAAGN